MQIFEPIFDVQTNPLWNMAHSFKALSTTALLKILLMYYTQRMSTSTLGDFRDIILLLLLYQFLECPLYMRMKAMLCST